MNFQVETRDNYSIFTIFDETIEGKSASELKAKILLVAQPDIKALIIDLSNVKVIDSSGLGALLLAHRQLNQHKIPVILVGMQDFIKELLKITHIDELFKYSDCISDAIS
ncbi:MAG: STAS domain-containing protein [Ignavibacteria bacterium]|jgi:anti-anti-sigma factor|nr:STAS domain-containing protein [Ignavibacteria bacterium]